MTDSGFRVTVARFGGAENLVVRGTEHATPSAGRIRVRVLAASVGSTDLLARRGGYLLQPLRGFTPGYDFVGEVLDGHPSDTALLESAGLIPGARVAVCLPSMGAYASHQTIAHWQAVAVPPELDTVTAAAIPLDYLTALSAFEHHARAESGQNLLIQGASGPVGAAIAQLAGAVGATCYGTASERNRAAVEREGVRFLDYARDDLVSVLRQNEPGGVHAAFDHRGGNGLRESERTLAAGGIAVSTAFTGRRGHERADTLTGGIRVALRGLVRPGGLRASVVSVPFEIRRDHERYRASLTRMLAAAVSARILARVDRTFAIEDAASAHRYVESGASTGKVVLTA